MKDKVTLTKAELADLMFEKVGLNKREAKDMVESFFEEIRIALERGEMVKLSDRLSRGPVVLNFYRGVW